MSEQEKEELTPNEAPKSLEAHGEKRLHKKTEEGGRTAKKEESAGDRVSLRFRRKNTRLHVIGFAIALFVLLIAVLYACMRKEAPSEDPSDTTAGEESTVEPSESTSEEHSLYEFDPSLVPDGEVAIRAADLSAESGTITNLTELLPDIEALTARFSAETPEAETETALSEPLVLILHTHATEGYSASGAISWDGIGDLARSQNGEENVIAVGEVLFEVLNDAGVPTLHCTTFHDVGEDGTVTYTGAYARSAATVAEYLTLYPSIRYVIDLGRDVVTDENGNLIRAVTMSGDAVVSQVMAVVGSSSGADYESNLALALALCTSLNADGASICRAPTLQESSCNQELSRYGLTLEIGTAANSLEEAMNAAVFVGEALAELILRIEG